MAGNIFIKKAVLKTICDVKTLGETAAVRAIGFKDSGSYSPYVTTSGANLRSESTVRATIKKLAATYGLPIPIYCFLNSEAFEPQDWSDEELKLLAKRACSKGNAVEDGEEIAARLEADDDAEFFRAFLRNRGVVDKAITTDTVGRSRLNHQEATGAASHSDVRKAISSVESPDAPTSEAAASTQRDFRIKLLAVGTVCILFFCSLVVLWSQFGRQSAETNAVEKEAVAVPTFNPDRRGFELQFLSLGVLEPPDWFPTTLWRRVADGLLSELLDDAANDIIAFRKSPLV